MPDHEVRGVFKEASEILYPPRGVEIKIDTRMDAAVSEVAVEGAFVAEAVIKRAKLSEIGSQARGRDRRVFPAFIAIPRAGNKSGRRQRRFPNSPDIRCFLGPAKKCGERSRRAV